MMENEKFQELVIDQLAKLNQKFDGLNQKVTEHGEILQAVRHAQEVHKAEFDQLNLIVARIEGHQEETDKTLDQMAGDISFLVRKSAEHGDQIRQLRRAK